MNRTIIVVGALLAHASPLFAADANPTDAAAAAPVAAYRSPFEGYRSSSEEPVASWLSLNADVARIGGHVGIMRGTQRPATSAPAPTASEPASGAHHH
jgi:hypothetical protein